MKIPGLSQKRGYWYYRPPQRGGIRPKRVSLRTKDQGEAVTLALELKHQSDHQLEGGRLSGEILRYLQHQRESRAWEPTTYQATQSTLKQLELFLGNPDCSAITRKRIEAWRSQLISEGKPDSSVKTYLRRAQGLFSWLKREGRIIQSPFKDLRVGRIQTSKAVTFCTREQRDRLLEACLDADTRFVLMCGFFLALRRREIVEAVPRWFHTPGVVEVSETPHYKPKDKERRMIHYGQQFSDFIKDWDLSGEFALRPSKKHGKAFYRVETRKWIEELGASCDLPWFRHHVMRHTFATLHVQAGTPLPVVADWLGDSYQVTHDHYVGYAPTNAHVRNLD